MQTFFDSPGKLILQNIAYYKYQKFKTELETLKRYAKQLQNKKKVFKWALQPATFASAISLLSIIFWTIKMMKTRRLHKVIFTNMRLHWSLLETNAQTIMLVKIWDKLEFLNIHPLCGIPTRLTKLNRYKIQRRAVRFATNFKKREQGCITAKLKEIKLPLLKARIEQARNDIIQGYCKK